MIKSSLKYLLVCLVASSAFSAEIYVSPTGDDNAAGTSAAPLKTIAKARDKADELKASGPVTVYLKDGTYYLTEPLVFAAKNSGTASAPITYKGCGKAVISGGVLLPSDLTWSVHSGSIMKTTIDKDLKVDQLFLNGKRQIMCRYPNFNENQMLQGSSTDALARAAAGAAPGEGPGYIRALHTSMWGGESYIITGKNGNQLTYAWVGDNNRGSGMHTQYRMVENVFELLDAPGEWFYRKSTGELFFYPPAGTTDLKGQKIELASLTELIRCVGTAGSSEGSVKYITFDNIILTHTFRSVFDGTGDFYEKVTKSDWGIVRKGTVFMQNAEHITVQNCLFDQIGGNGVFMSGYNRYNVVYNCDIEEGGASGVCLFGLRSSLRCPNTWSGTVSCSDRTPGPLTEEYPSHCRIENNLMNKIGRFEKQIAGFTASATEFDTVRHNTIKTIPRAGINFCDGAWGGHLVEYNWVSDCVRESGDHGPFNSWGRDRNEIFGQNDVAASKLDARNTTMVKNNRFEGEPGNFGIDLDDQSTNYYQIYNLCIGGGHKLQWHRFNTYVNNVIIDGNVQFHGVWGQSQHYGARLIIYQSKEPCVYQFCCGSNPTQVKGAITQWDSNVVYYTKGEPKCSDWNNCGSGNFSWSQWKAAGLDAHSSNADPMFVDPSKGDYRVKDGSPALKLGFKNFAMDSFGVAGVPGPNTNGCTATAIQQGDKAVQNGLITEKLPSVQYNAHQLAISFNGEYTVEITSISGRILSVYQGKGHTLFSLDKKQIKSGLYLAVVRTKNGLTTHGIVVSR
jgi:hypothetical protein